MGGVLPRTSTMTVSLTENVAHQALSSGGTGSLARAKCPNPSDTYNRSPASGLQNKSDRRVCRHFAARVTITFYTASARFQLAARSVALC